MICKFSVEKVAACLNTNRPFFGVVVLVFLRLFQPVCATLALFRFVSASFTLTTIAVGNTSLEPGPSRARYFPRDMLLLTTTARERAWRLLKITSPLIGWFAGDSPIPGISPWLAPLSRCTLYIVEVQRTLCSSLFVFEIRTVASHKQPCILSSGSSIAKVWSVKSSMRCENQSRLQWRGRCVTSSMHSESICNDVFFFAHLPIQ